MNRARSRVADSARSALLAHLGPREQSSLSTQKDGEVQHLSTDCDASLQCLSTSTPITSVEARNEAHNAAYFSYQDRIIALGSPGRHAIVASFSCDGVHFSRFLDVAPAGDAGAGRTFHQPFDGLVVEEGMVYAYVQENVRGLDMDRSDDDPLYPSAPPRVVRYGTSLIELARRAFEETRGLAGC